jgi:hypothetical protein
MDCSEAPCKRVTSTCHEGPVAPPAPPNPGCSAAPGEALRAGWPPVLRLLEAVPGGGDAAAVGAAFAAVQLLAADHLAALPLSLLAHSLRMAALYASQQVRGAARGALSSGQSQMRQLDTRARMEGPACWPPALRADGCRPGARLHRPWAASSD